MILVTGGAGFLGRRVVRTLAHLGHKRVRCMVRPGTPSDVFAEDLRDYPGTDVEVVPASFNDRIALEEGIRDVEVVYHLAASRKGSAAVMVANSVIGSENIYQAAVRAGVRRFVLVSSLAVMGVGRLGRGSIVDERTRMEEHPEWRDAYSFSKHRQEMLAWKHFEYDRLPLVVVRPGVIFGPGSEILGPRIGLRFGGVFLHLGGVNEIPLTYVDNCAEAVVLAGTASGIEGEVFCIVDDGLAASGYLLRRYCKEVRRLRVIRIPYRLLTWLAKCNVWYSSRTKGHLPAVITPYEVELLWKGHRFGNQKAKELLGWHPTVSMEEALNATYSSLAWARGRERQNQC